ncbi:hypothetical protein ILUMI_11566 [Ignelater luminosus]|uniref:Pacifastin domain-containing protein n=1 Tax=Ignelater luminosus TaxID=2038154 RepID=A0A8K0G7L1_IGNLU|nr:hypothetical protein ILUMI_11566 [Ignelater luminosus]
MLSFSFKYASTVILFYSIYESNAAQRFWCTPNTEWMEDCNKCWCLDKGVPLCTKVPCNIKNVEDSVNNHVKKRQISIINFFVSTISIIGIGVVVNFVGNLIWSGIMSYIDKYFRRSSDTEKSKSLSVENKTASESSDKKSQN